jgi:hypothetical protein
MPGRPPPVSNDIQKLRGCCAQFAIPQPHDPDTTRQALPDQGQ